MRAADFLEAEMSVICRSNALVAPAGPAIMVAITMAGSKLGLILDATACSLQGAESKPGANVYSVDKTNESQFSLETRPEFGTSRRYDSASAQARRPTYIRRADPVFCC